jgi:hypothetical protein
MSKRIAVLLGTLVVLILSFPPVVWGQTATGQITGTVKDSSGAVMPQVKITVSNQSTGFARNTVSDDAGTYSFPLLPVGIYSVTGEQQGFSIAKRSEIKLNVDQVLRIDLDMSVGTTADTVTVQANAVAIDSETSAIGTMVTSRQVTELPLNGRNFLQLLFIGAGAVETGGEQGSMRQGAGNAISINGSRPTSNNYLLDGTSNTDTALGTPAVVLSVDAIQEFKEQTATYSAEYGFSANQINIISKTGTNDLHGSVFWFLRNDALDAFDTFVKMRATPGEDLKKNKLRQNQPGFVAGGPVFIPKLYNGKNKTFWLANYEGRRTRNGFQNLLTVPTPDQLAGKFTSQILDPVTGLPFSGNVVPVSRNTRLANLAIAKFIPAPNYTGTGGNFIIGRALPTDTDQYTLRFDQNLGKYGAFFGRVTNSNWTSISSQNTTQLGDVYFSQKTRNWQVSHSVPITPNLVNQFRIGYIDATANQYGVAAPESEIDALNMTGVFTTLNEQQRSYPAISFGGVGSGLSGGGSAVNDYQASNQGMWDVSNGTTWVKGRHTLNFGMNFRKWSLNRDLANDFLGQFTFSGFFTGNQTPDNAVADMLLGYFSGASAFQPAGFSVEGKSGNPRSFNFMYLAPYFQDDWKVSSRLTLNLGVRWDFRTVPNETNDRMGWRDLANPQGGLLVADKTLVEKGIVGDGTYYKYAGRRNPMDASKHVYAPRIGFAFRPFANDKTVIRGGYGVFFDSAEGREIDGAADIYPYVSRGQYSQTLGQAAPLFTTDQMFPSFANLGPATPAANSFLAVSMSPEPRNPYVQQWSFSIQRALTANTTIDVNYIGNKGTHLLMRRQIAQAYPLSDPSVCQADPSIGNCPVLARRPFPNFSTYIDSDWSGNSIYNSGNVKLEHRSNNVIFTTVYTWAKSIDSKSAAAGIGNDVAGWQGFLDNHNVRRDRGRSEFNVDHRLVGSFVYQIPVGRGMKFGSSMSAVADAFIGGWQVNGIATFQVGFPMTISANDAGGLNDTFGTNRADIVGDINAPINRSIAQWFNTAAFKQPGLGYLGNSGRSILNAPGINNWDTGLFKNFKIKERANVQFRFESFNSWNHTQWGVPDRNIGDPIHFGQVRGARAARINQAGLKFVF